ncbi:hypothetical protein NQU50_31525, partial [Escherichia coli]|uniref:hypothetical protein n=1 Tax=Escherichia coli TaxID=562 RepID=UPI002117B09B
PPYPKITLKKLLPPFLKKPPIFTQGYSFFSTIRRKGKVDNEVVLYRESSSQKIRRLVGMIRRGSVASGIGALLPDAA